MDEKLTKILIVGYGNIGKAVHQSVEVCSDMELSGIVTRRPVKVVNEIKEKGYSSDFVFDLDTADDLASLTDVAILCGGSKNDLPVQGPYFAQYFNTVDSFDTHPDILDYFKKMDKVAKDNENLSLISGGWDPGTFSSQRVMANAFLSNNSMPQAFYGLTERGGLSQGHSDAIRQIQGVKDARQYTHAVPEAIEQAKKGKSDLKVGERVWRECFVVLDETSDYDLGRKAITKAIKQMPSYFKNYRTEVNFVSQKELERVHSDMPHDGVVIAATQDGRNIEYACKWPSNPNGTAGILVACARAVHRFYNKGKTGAITMLDVPPALYSTYSKEDLLRDFM